MSERQNSDLRPECAFHSRKTRFNRRHTGCAPAHNGCMSRRAVLVVVVAACLPVVGCGGTESSPTSPTAAMTATVRFVYRASTTPRTDLPADAQDCVRGVGRTHIHPSWRGFARIDMTPVGADRWEIAFSDVPVDARQSIRVSDGNACNENPTGAATRNVFANDVLLVEVVPTPGSGTEPGLAFTVSSDGRVTP